VSLQSSLLAWDGKSADDIGQIFQSHKSSKDFTDNLLQLITGSQLANTQDLQNVQKGATWLLKAWLEAGGMLSLKQTNSVYRQLAQLAHWESRLHVLQSLPFLKISKSNKSRLESFLRECLVDSNKFVRAWTYNGWHLLAQQHPEYQEEVEKFLEMAMRDEAPSVKARIRNLLN